ncbi:MAG: hypothetical protein LBK67_08110 [Coriobacteriales bacterium]|jgi:hypothetical protein|nr:hypothetical protein [Coriobacteriales bacterium]
MMQMRPVSMSDKERTEESVTKRAFKCTWGMNDQEWGQHREFMRAVIVGVAQSKTTITYGELSEIVFDRRFSARSSALAQMLEEVCTLEDAQTDVELGSVVVRADSGIPGKGYFLYAREHLDRHINPSDPASCRHFWQNEIRRVWDIYDTASETEGRG